MLAYLGDQLYEGTQEQLHRLSLLLPFHWAVKLGYIEGNVFTKDGETWYPITAAPDQPIQSGNYWYLVGDESRPYGAFDAPEGWPVEIDLSTKTANIPIKHL